MLSKLSMSLSETDRRPQIVLRLQRSEDLRDTVFQMFVEDFGHLSKWCRVKFSNPPKDASASSETILEIIPITPDELREEVERIQKYLHENYPVKCPDIDLNEIRRTGTATIFH